MEHLPTVSVIIPAHNEDATLSNCLHSLEQLDYPMDKLEIILINDGSTDGTKRIISEHLQSSPYVYLETDGRGPSKARNTGLEKAKGDYVAFTDADCIVDREWLNELLNGFIADDVAGVGGCQTIPEDASDFEKSVHGFLTSMHFICEYVKKLETIAIVDHVASCNSLYRRQVLEAVHGFDEQLWPGEDVDLDYKIRREGYRIAYNPNAVVAHHRPKNIRAFLSMMKRYGWSQAYLLRNYGFFRTLQYVPFAALLLFIGWLFALTYNLSLGIGLAIFGIVGIFMAFILKTGLKQGWDNFVLFMITLVSWHAGFLRGLLGWPRR
jgi:cellulose synthase/poly-beta-1,6-N-acetylglucosamine synthase-like glycosyltransferase